MLEVRIQTGWCQIEVNKYTNIGRFYVRVVFEVRTEDFSSELKTIEVSGPEYEQNGQPM